jgi:hypothetical protein
MMFSLRWHAIGREGHLSAEELATGVTILGRPTMLQKGLYTQAFFALSIGMERLAKLIVLADFAIGNAVRYPTNQQLKDLGHGIEGLMKRCEEISLRYRSGQEYSIRPKEPIHQGIVTVLSEFGILSRYYNLDFLAGGKAAKLTEPIAAWWTRVDVPILASTIPTRSGKRMRRARLTWWFRLVPHLFSTVPKTGT